LHHWSLAAAFADGKINSLIMAAVILVNEKNEDIGTAEKMEVHVKGLLHRAFSVFVFNSKGKLLLQQRATKKYHSGGLWTNACCGHPAPGEILSESARKRLKEEMGFEILLQEVGAFIYEAQFSNGLSEHEFDHVFAGQYDGPVPFNEMEVMDVCYKKIEDIKNSLNTHPQKYTAWFPMAFEKVEEWWKLRFGK
jgi:isopentenyl-diphosphate Delta-isomerase